HESDVTLIRSRAAIRAARHAHAQFLLFQTQSTQFQFELINDSRHYPLGFRQSQPASRHSRACHAMTPYRAQLFRTTNSKLLEHLLDFGSRVRIEVAEKKILDRSDPQVWLKALHDRAQTGTQTMRAIVLDATILDAQAVVPFAVALRM